MSRNYADRKWRIACDPGDYLPDYGAHESAANACQSGATLTGRGVDPLAREYLVAADEIARLRDAHKRQETDPG